MESSEKCAHARASLHQCWTRSCVPLTLAEAQARAWATTGQPVARYTDRIPDGNTCCGGSEIIWCHQLNSIQGFGQIS